MSSQPPYGAPPGGGYPPSGGYPGGGYPPPGGYPPAQPRIRFNVIGEAWALFQQDVATWILAALIYVGIVFAINFCFGLLIGGAEAVSSSASRPSFFTFSAFFGLRLVVNLASYVISVFLMGGMYRMAVKKLRNNPIQVSDIFSVGDVLPALLLGAFLVGLASGVGFILCIIPGLIIGGLLMFTIPLIVDRHLGAIDAMGQSWNALKGDLLNATLFFLVVSILGVIGALACGVGILVTIPLLVLSIALAYRDFFG